ncbi:hypothetical protein AAE478_007008 [Parahypoxylon ruwenzoriense]
MALVASTHYSGYSKAEYRAFLTEQSATAWLVSTNTTVVTVKSKSRATRYYAVAVGRTPGIYTDCALAVASRSGFPGAKLKRFNTRAKAEQYMRVHGSSISSWSNSVEDLAMAPPPFMLAVYESAQHKSDIQSFPAGTCSIKREDSLLLSAQPPLPVEPPPSSFFAQFQDFAPENSTPFDDEFSRCMSSQGIAPRTAEYKRQRTKAVLHELKFHYSSQQPSHDASLSQVEREQTRRLQIYQNMCRAVHLPMYTTESACVAALRTVLVNIVDYVDAARMRRPIRVWSDFDQFRDYTLRDDKRFDLREAKADGGFLAVFLQKLRGSRGGAKKRKREESVAEESIIKRERIL